jgi:hypothetical protein
LPSDAYGSGGERGNAGRGGLEEEAGGALAWCGAAAWGREVTREREIGYGRKEKVY